MIRLWGSQLAAYDHMVADAPLLALLRLGADSITEEPLQDDPGPYILLGTGTGVPQDLLVETGGQQTLTLQVWHRNAPLQRVKQILDRLSIIFQGVVLVVDGKPTLPCIVELSEAAMDEVFARGVFRVRIETFG